MRFLLLLSLLLLTNCVAPRPTDTLHLESMNFSSLPGWQSDHQNEVLPALLKSCEKLLKKPAEKSIGKLALAGTERDWQPICIDARKLPLSNEDAVRHFFENAFIPYKVSGNKGEKGLFTGYYEVDLHGSLTKRDRYTQPLYRYQEGHTSYSRTQIDRGILAGKGLELVYVDDPVKAFFLHIQGSGRVMLEDGRIIRVGYAGQNGFPYVAIGRYLEDIHAIEKGKVSAITIKDWLYKHPQQALQAMEQNPSYVFFKDNSNLTEGPIGAQGVPLTKGRSLAVDKRYIPLGMPLWLDTTSPATGTNPATPLQRLMIAQDTGGAIKGVVRGDIFFGNGDDAEELAGSMKNKGSYYLLLPKKLDKNG